jgi:hypothetical protein
MKKNIVTLACNFPRPCDLDSPLSGKRIAFFVSYGKTARWEAVGGLAKFDTSASFPSLHKL